MKAILFTITLFINASAFALSDQLRSGPYLDLREHCGDLIKSGVSCFHYWMGMMDAIKALESMGQLKAETCATVSGFNGERFIKATEMLVGKKAEEEFNGASFVVMAYFMSQGCGDGNWVLQ